MYLQRIQHVYKCNRHKRTVALRLRLHTFAATLNGRLCTVRGTFARNVVRHSRVREGLRVCHVGLKPRARLHGLQHADARVRV